MTCILLVEDNEMNRDMLTRRLQRQGFAVITAADAQAALTAAQQQQPQLVLMDLSLPGMDGWQATQLLKSNPLTAAIPVIALTAHIGEHMRERAMQIGCDDYDCKPIDFTRLLAKIEVLLCSTGERQ